MTLDLDPRSPVPLYQQIVEQVRHLVAAGALRDGDRLPTVRELAVQARVNRNTAARAIQDLEREGIVRTRVGQGTFVAEGASKVHPARLEEALDSTIDRLLVEARLAGVGLEELGWRLSRRIEAFRRRGGREGARTAEAPRTEEKE
jgi:GntR family transcriptional regulator